MEYNWYHYTSLNALFGILKNKEFWWGNASSMNDKSELTDFVNKLHNAVVVGLSRGKIVEVENFFERVNNRLKNEYPYLMSLSTLRDDAAQWERYADNANGVCISLNTSIVQAVLCSNSMLFNNVFYSYDIRDHAYYKILIYYFETGELSEGFTSIEGLIDNILLGAACYKHKSFSAESEIRLITLPYFTEHLDTNCSRIEFECVGGKIKKILKINIGQLCEKIGYDISDLFEEIIIGPRSTQSIDDLADFCASVGYPSLAKRLSYSICPLR